jgi:hypothetical protein
VEYKEKKYNYVYKITNLVNGKYYIGIHSTNNIRDNYRGSGKYLWNSYRKYGFENFVKEFLYFQKTRDEILRIEKEIVNKEFVKDIHNMNIMEGGKGGFISEEHQLKISKLGGLAFGERLKRDKDFREKMRIISSNIIKKLHKTGKVKYDNFKGKKHTEETKRKVGLKISQQSKGKPNTSTWIFNLETGEELKVMKCNLDNILKDKKYRKGRKRK